jgi:chromosome segregation ATPase
VTSVQISALQEQVRAESHFTKEAFDRNRQENRELSSALEAAQDELNNARMQLERCQSELQRYEQDLDCARTDLERNSDALQRCTAEVERCRREREQVMLYVCACWCCDW